MLELTTLDGLPVFVDLESLELVEQQEDGTCIVTKSGQLLFVLESAAEINVERTAYEQVKLAMMGLT